MCVCVCWGGGGGGGSEGEKQVLYTLKQYICTQQSSACADKNVT